MFRHLLVPLDGSRLAEAALPAAAYLAHVLDADVTLIHVIERGAPHEIHGDRHLTTPSEAEDYLAEVAERTFPPTVHVTQHVHTAAVDDVVRSIVTHVGEFVPDLVVMCTHGSGGLRGWLFGSIAQQVVALNTIPVLLVRPNTAAAATFACRQILVPLDGDPEHESSIAVAAWLAATCDAALQLATVIPTYRTLSGQDAAAGIYLPGTMSALLDLTEEEASRYLRRHVVGLQTQGLTASAHVARGDPASCIVNRALRLGADLIILATHGKAGMTAFWEGSVASKVALRSPVPLLLMQV